MKVVHVIPNLKRGGAERLVLDICIELAFRDGYVVKLITFEEANDYPELTQNIDWQVVKSDFIPSISGRNTKNIAALQALISSINPDVIHSHLWKAEIVTRQLTCPNAKWFTHFHSNIKQLSKVKIPFSKQEITNGHEKRLLVKQYKKNNSYFICISKDTLQYAKDVLPKSLRSKIYLLANGINYPKFHFSQVRKLDTIKIINVGSFVQKKNQKLALFIAEEIKKRGKKVELHFLGDGPDFSLVKQLAADLSLEDCVHFHGSVSNVEDYLKASNIYLHTANYEPFGLVCVEAMASGLPVFTLNGKGNSDLIVEGKNGFLFQQEDVSLISDKIISLFKDKEGYRTMSKAACQFAESYDVKSYCDKLIQLYNCLF